jgi:hypothetical protein
MIQCVFHFLKLQNKHYDINNVNQILKHTAGIHSRNTAAIEHFNVQKCGPLHSTLHNSIQGKLM